LTHTVACTLCQWIYYTL